MRSFVLLLALYAITSATPIPLRDNYNRMWDREDVFTHSSEKEMTFLGVNNFSFQAGNRFYISDDSTIDGNRLMMFFADSLRYKWVYMNVEGKFDQRGIYGYDIDWSDPDEPGKAAERASFDLHRAMLVIEPAKWIKLGIGKDQYNWGPLQLGGLMLSDYNMGLVGLYQEYNVGPFAIKGIVSQLNSTPWGYGKDYEGVPIIHRYFSASRIEFYRERFGIAIAQSAIYAGEGRSFEIPYLIPIFPFHYAQMSNWRYGNDGDNSYGGFDFYVNFLDKQLELYGEVFIDDFQGEMDDASQSVQNNVAGMAGLKWDFVKGPYGFLEGGQINSFVYNHVSGEKLRYQTKNAFIGSPLGPDQRLLWGQAGYRFPKNISVDLTGWWRQSGERDISHEYESVAGTRKDPIPFGTVEHEISTWLTGKYRWRGISAELNGGFTRYLNVNHVESVDATNYFFGLFLKSGINLSWKQKEK